MFSGRIALFKIGSIVAMLAAMAAAATAAPLLSDTQTRAALAALSHAPDDGLDPDHYRITNGRDGEAIKAALLAYMRDMENGRADLKALDRDVSLPASPFDAEAALGQAGTELQPLLASLAPPDPGYARLKSALARYRAIAAGGGWPTLDLRSDPAQLGARLDMEDGALTSDPAAALKRFQARHGLTPDGVLGRTTLAALNIPAAVRANTIAANMERWRWLPHELEADRIVINAADARLEMFL